MPPVDISRSSRIAFSRNDFQGDEMDLFIIWLLFSVICAFIAPSRGRRAGSWFILGLLFGFFALIALALMPNLRDQKAEEKDRKADAETCACPHCAERIKRAARVCKHCGRDVEPQERQISAQNAEAARAGAKMNAPSFKPGPPGWH